MLTLRDIPEILEDLASGLLAWPEAFPLLASILGEHDVDVVLLRLPDRWRASFVASLQASFDTARDDDPPARRAIGERVRAWLAKQAGDQE